MCNFLKSIFGNAFELLWGRGTHRQAHICFRPSAEHLEARRLLAFDPSPIEQELIQLTNRFRSDPTGEFGRLISVASPILARDPVLQTDLDFFKVDGNLLRNELAALSPAPPLAINEALQAISATHNANMAAQKIQFHQSLSTVNQQLLSAGVNVSALGESVYGFGKSTLHIHAAYIIDWGVGTGGMQGTANNRPHRNNAISTRYNQFSTPVLSYSGSGFGPLVNTQDFATVVNSPNFVVGAVFQDKNNSNWYDAGEGIGKVNIVFEGSPGKFTTTAFSAGGYQLQVPAGTYKVTVSGTGLKYPIVVNSLIVGNSSLWKNFLYDPTLIPPDVYEINDTLATAKELTGANQTLSGLTLHSSSDVDYFHFVSPGTGTTSILLTSSAANGAIRVNLLNQAGAVIATSNLASGKANITSSLLRSNGYYLQILSPTKVMADSFQITLSLPPAQPPVANPDRASITSETTAIEIDILVNDTDPDGDRQKLVPRLLTG
ncbi:MAG: hypothetical protein KDB03_23335, partial [Planctomycetales bacterium]|nr:hypothetical protein [Planctomycetales bacterium]